MFRNDSRKHKSVSFKQSGGNRNELELPMAPLGPRGSHLSHDDSKDSSISSVSTTSNRQPHDFRTLSVPPSQVSAVGD